MTQHNSRQTGCSNTPHGSVTVDSEGHTHPFNKLVTREKAETDTNERRERESEGHKNKIINWFLFDWHVDSRYSVMLYIFCFDVGGGP